MGAIKVWFPLPYVDEEYVAVTAADIIKLLVGRQYFISSLTAKLLSPISGSLRADMMTLHVGLGSSPFTNSFITRKRRS
jgi:hypothetical protein